jgi:hypothetical protein
VPSSAITNRQQPIEALTPAMHHSEPYRKPRVPKQQKKKSDKSPVTSKLPKKEQKSIDFINQLYSEICGSDPTTSKTTLDQSSKQATRKNEETLSTSLLKSQKSSASRPRKAQKIEVQDSLKQH